MDATKHQVRTPFDEKIEAAEKDAAEAQARLDGIPQKYDGAFVVPDPLRADAEATWARANSRCHALRLARTRWIAAEEYERTRKR